MRLEAPVGPVGALAEVAGRDDLEPLGVGDDQRAGGVGAAQPLLTRDRQEVEPMSLVGDRADRLGTVGEHGNAAPLAQLAQRQHRPGGPEHAGGCDEPRARADGCGDAVGIGRHDDDLRRGGAERPEQPEVLVGGRHDLVLRTEAEPAQDDPAAVGRRRRQRDRLGPRPDERAERGAEVLPERERLLEVRLTRPPPDEVPLDTRLQRLRNRSRERPEGAGVEVGDRLQHREQRPRLRERHSSTSTVASTTGWSESTTPFCRRRSSGHAPTDVTSAPRTRTWSIPPTGRE